jgi:succinyl-CoA synthetase beta subunit/citryl-CoA synthetase large subunit
MRLLEDAAKEALRSAGVDVPRGAAVADARAAALAAAGLVGTDGRVAVKALVAAGRRGKAGAVAVCSAADCEAAASRMLGGRVDGRPIDRLYVEEAVDIAAELYASFAFGALAPRLVVSRFGGVDIEDVARERPEAIVMRDIDPIQGLRTWHAAAAWEAAGLAAAQVPKLAELTVKLYRAFCASDGLMLELNPIAITPEGVPRVVGAMLEVDDNALHRHPDWEESAQESAGPGGRALTAGERAVAVANRTFPGGATRYTELDGDIGLLVSGGGASLYQHDLILEYGGRPANHTDFSPTPTPDKHVAVLDAILDRPTVRGLLVGCNYLQLARCDLIVEALAIVLRKRGIDPGSFPIVIRLFGPNEAEARAIAGAFPGVRYMPRGTTLAEACRAIVESVRALPARATAQGRR